jgi:uncharacterized membrane protein
MPGNFLIGIALLVSHAFERRHEIAKGIVQMSSSFVKSIKRIVVFLFGTGLMLWLFFVSTALLVTIMVAAFPIALVFVVIFFVLNFMAKARRNDDGRNGGGQP